MKAPWLRSCREISVLLLAREDRNLRWPERMAIRVHFLLCKACPRFERQILTMRSALDQWRAYRDDGGE